MEPMIIKLEPSKFEKKGHYFGSWQDTYEFLYIKDDGVQTRHVSSLNLSSTCNNCDEYLSFRTYDSGETVELANNPCEYEGGVAMLNVIEFKSGRVILDDDLRDVYSVPDEVEDKFASYNTSLGQAQATAASFELGCAYGPVGNSCPSLYRTGDGTYVIANPAYDDDYEVKPLNTTWVELGAFCTDLWAFSMADYDDFLVKGGTPVEENNQNGTRVVIDFPPGTYAFVHHTGDVSFTDEGPGPTIYTSIEKIS